MYKRQYNKGLGLALTDGVLACSYDFIARMDTDDIAREDRFEIQLKIDVYKRQEWAGRKEVLPAIDKTQASGFCGQ